MICVIMIFGVLGLVGVAFVLKLGGINLLLVDCPPGVHDVGQHKRNEKRNIAHSSEGVMARRTVLYGERVLEIESGRVVGGVVKAGNQE